MVNYEINVHNGTTIYLFIISTNEFKIPSMKDHNIFTSHFFNDNTSKYTHAYK